MHDDDFLRAILADPHNDEQRLVYADWLEEQDDAVSLAKADFLRTTVALSPAPDQAQKTLHQQRLQTLAAQLDTDWLGIVSRLPIELCGQKTEGMNYWYFSRLFEFVCNRQWDELKPTAEKTVRFCDGCQKHVYYCDTIVTAREHANQQHCVVVDVGIIRREDDLAPQRLWMGRPSLATLQAEEERMRPDPVSAERECRKQQLPKSHAKS